MSAPAIESRGLNGKVAEALIQAGLDPADEFVKQRLRLLEFTKNEKGKDDVMSETVEGIRIFPADGFKEHFKPGEYWFCYVDIPKGNFGFATPLVRLDGDFYASLIRANLPENAPSGIGNASGSAVTTPVCTEPAAAPVPETTSDGNDSSEKHDSEGEFEYTIVESPVPSRYGDPRDALIERLTKENDSLRTENERHRANNLDDLAKMVPVTDNYGIRYSKDNRSILIATLSKFQDLDFDIPVDVPHGTRSVLVRKRKGRYNLRFS